MSNSKKQTASYVAEMSSELAKLSAAVDNPTLATLLRLAAKIAKQQVGEDQDAKPRVEPTVLDLRDHSV